MIDVADGTDVHMRLVAVEFVTGGSEGTTSEVEAGGGCGCEETPGGGLGDGVEGSSRHGGRRSLLLNIIKERGIALTYFVCEKEKGWRMCDELRLRGAEKDPTGEGQTWDS